MNMAECRNVKKRYPNRRGYLRGNAGEVKAVDDVSIAIGCGECFGLVGESGCGKTTLGKIILGIVKPDSGQVDLAARRPQVIFQDPQNSLDPKMKVRDIVAESLILRNQSEALRARVEEVLDLVKLPEAAFHKFPHEFSGGERQRIAIARAVVTRPEFIVCDEPVSSLDVTIQLDILKLLKEIQAKFSMTYLFISHDLRVIKFMCDRVAVMREGKIVESGVTADIYNSPTHPYTKLLLSSILSLSPRR